MEYVFPRIRSPLLHHYFFLSKAVKGLLKPSNLNAFKAPASASPFFTAEGDEMASERHILMSAVMFSLNGL